MHPFLLLLISSSQSPNGNIFLSLGAASKYSMHHKYSLSYILLKNAIIKNSEEASVISVSNIFVLLDCIIFFFLHKLLLSYAEKAGVMIAIAGMSNDMQETKYGLRIFKV